MNSSNPVLDVKKLTVEFSSEDGPLRAVDEVSFQIRRGEIVGLVGESGAGKSLTSEAILGLIRRPPGRMAGEVWFGGRDLLALDEAALAHIRGKDIAMIFQNPGASLNPVFRVGEQMLEAMALHLPEPRGALKERVVETLGRVGISSPQTRARDYPHQFSGGMAQRVMIGMGVSCTPSLLIADEPTSALDVATEAQVWRNLEERLRGHTAIVIAHRLSTARRADRIVVIEAGAIVEQGTHDELMARRGAYFHLWQRDEAEPAAAAMPEER